MCRQIPEVIQSASLNDGLLDRADVAVVLIWYVGGKFPFRSPVRSTLVQFADLICRTALRQKIRNVAFLREVGQLHDPDGRRCTEQHLGDFHRVLAARLIVVGKDHHTLVGKPERQIRLEVSGSAVVACRRDSGPREVFCVLLALNDRDQFRLGNQRRLEGQGLHAAESP